MWVCVTVHVLSVWLVTGVAGKDVTRSHPTLHTRFPHLNFSLDHLSRGAGAVPLSPIELRCVLPKRIDNDYTSCGDGYCRCQNAAADCSGHYGNLTYIPALPLGISTLSFALNRLTTIDHDDFFLNVTNIVTLNLIGNGLSLLSDGAFRSLGKLKILWLAGNRLTYTALAPVLSVTTLTFLDLSFVGVGAPPDRLFHTFPLPHLETLCMIDMRIGPLNMSVFTPLPKLNYLDLSYNQLMRETLIPAFLLHLNNLILESNSFNNFPQSCADFGSFLPNLTVLDMSGNVLNLIPEVSVCFPRLELFMCVSCRLATIPTNAFGEHLFPSLHKIFIARSVGMFKTEIQSYAFNNTKLNYIGLSNRDIDFSIDSTHLDCFAGCPNLQALVLNDNDLSKVSVQKLQRLFNNDNLILLWLPSTNLGQISAEMLANVPKLIILSLYSNKLTDITDGTFDRLEHLELLDLSSNRISVVRETTFSPATRQRLRYVDIGNNPFHCDCDLKWFRQILTTQPGLFRCGEISRHCTPYTCDNLVNTTVQSFYVADQACLWSPAVSKFILATVFLLILPLTAGAVIYRYRWHIRLLMYEAARGQGDRWRRLQEQDFRYDVFVCYDSEDLEWVRAHLMPELEERLGLKLCIHSRDFTLGAPIVENIEESVETSKKIMMVFSKNFADSHWCQFELMLCLTHVLEHGDALLVVLLEDIASRDLTPAMMALMKTVTYIEWEDDAEARASFWGRMRLALYEILE